jgi:hypothetical protein
MGVISTPPKGGINLRAGMRNGSVGRAISFQGRRVSSTWGYQVKIMRKMNKTVIRARKMPREILIKSIWGWLLFLEIQPILRNFQAKSQNLDDLLILFLVQKTISSLKEKMRSPQCIAFFLYNW